MIIFVQLDYLNKHEHFSDDEKVNFLNEKENQSNEIGTNQEGSELEKSEVLNYKDMKIYFEKVISLG